MGYGYFFFLNLCALIHLAIPAIEFSYLIQNGFSFRTGVSSQQDEALCFEVVKMCAGIGAVCNLNQLL